MHNKLSLKKVLRFAGNLLTILAFVFIVKKISSYGIDYKSLFSGKNLLLEMLFCLIYSGCVCALAYSWKLSLDFISESKNVYVRLMPIYVKSNLAKYIPGNVMQYAARNALGKSLEVSQTQIAFSTFYEIVVLCVSCCLWSLLLSGKTIINLLLQYIADYTIFRIILFLGIASIIVIFVFLYFAKKDWLRKNLLPFFSKKGCLLFAKTFLIYAFFMFVGAFIMVVILSRSIVITGEDLPLIFAAYITSWIIGYIVIGAPGGIGIREAVMTLLLSDLCGADTVALAAVIHRIITIAGDVLAWLIGIVTEKLNSKIRGDAL